MISVDAIRKLDNKIVIMGSHPGIVQSILDFDFLAGKQQPSVVAIIASGRKSDRFFWGESEVIIPVVDELDKLEDKRIDECTAVVNVQSARRVLASSKAAIDAFPNLKVLVIFAEHTPELHTRELYAYVAKKDVLVLGPSSVGLLIPASIKLGAIAGTQHEQLASGKLYQVGDTAVISTSGGMVNELVHTVARSGLGVSFAMALGGDRYPVLSPAEAIRLAERDKATRRIVFFGELGGIDEYEIAALIAEKKVTKEVISYIAGTVAELFDQPPQFGHAKALAQSEDETASAKKKALADAGAIVCDTFDDISKNLKKHAPVQTTPPVRSIGNRKRSLIVSHISGDAGGSVQLIGRDLLAVVNEHTTASLYASLLLGREVRSEKVSQFVDFCLRLLVDHGPHVSGALNTIVTARAGKDLVSSLSAGLLSIGPRFGGAINGAADGWLNAVSQGKSPKDFVNSYAQHGGIIPGIGHKKYRLDSPDPRVVALEHFSNNKNGNRHFLFARSVEQITVAKKSSLILNVDGAIAAIMLDIIESELGYDQKQLKELVDIEFFNALFVLSRSVGFAAHYLDQRRHDEGLLRLPDDDVRYVG